MPSACIVTGSVPLFWTCTVARSFARSSRTLTGMMLTSAARAADVVSKATGTIISQVTNPTAGLTVRMTARQAARMAARMAVMPGAASPCRIVFIGVTPVSCCPMSPWASRPPEAVLLTRRPRAAVDRVQ